MSRSGAGKDQAGREFEALLAALPRRQSAAPVRAAARSSRAPVGDSEFENLLNEFRSLSNPAASVTAAKAPAVAPRQPADSIQHTIPGQNNLVQALGALGRERDHLMIRLETIHDESALKAIDGLNRQITHLQISVMREQPDKFLLVRAGGQHFSLSLNDVVRVLWHGEAERDDKKGVRHDSDWLPVHAVSSRQLGKSSVNSAGAEDVIAIVSSAEGVLAICVDSVLGVVSATQAPLDAVLQGAQGLKGTAITETGLHALVLDVDRLAQRA
jgi:chemotaxis protein histidine kinase CheA